MKRRAFTLIELMVAVGMLAMIIAFTSVIFRFAIDAHRVSVANAEIMQKARAITEQLNSDFRGLRKDAPLLIWFKQDDPIDLEQGEDPNRYDQIMFFASGDFSSYQLYNQSDGEPLEADEDIDNKAAIIRGNLARIQYAHATNSNGDDIEDIKRSDRLLSRRTHILYSNPETGLKLEPWPDFNNVDKKISDYYVEDYYEHDTMLMADWKNPKSNNYSTVEEIYEKEIIPKVFVGGHPRIDKADAGTLHLLLCEEVSSFAVQWAYWDENEDDDLELCWFPNDNPNGGSSNNDSHFDIDNIENEFGIYLNVSDVNDIDITEKDWYDISQFKKEWDSFPLADNYMISDFPSALKFTFQIYDSKNVIEGGKTFTHIIYLGD